MPASSCAETVRQIAEFLLQRRLGDLPGNERAEGYLRIAGRGTGGEVPASMTTYARRLGLFSATMAVMGGIIGSGVFLGPQIVAARVGSAGLTLVAWVVGGVIALAGAFCFGELGARRPRAGGGYVYLREAFGPLPAFLYGWALLLVIATGATAAVAVTFASYGVALLGVSPRATLPLAIGAIVLLCGVNYVGVKPSAAGPSAGSGRGRDRLSARHRCLPAGARGRGSCCQHGSSGRPHGRSARARRSPPDQRRHRAVDIRISEPGDPRDAARVPGDGR